MGTFTKKSSLFQFEHHEPWGQFQTTVHAVLVCRPYTWWSGVRASAPPEGAHFDFVSLTPCKRRVESALQQYDVIWINATPNGPHRRAFQGGGGVPDRA